MMWVGEGLSMTRVRDKLKGIHPVSQSVSQSINQSISHSVSQSVIQSTNQSSNQSVNQSFNQAVNQSITFSHAGRTNACRSHRPIQQRHRARSSILHRARSSILHRRNTSSRTSQYFIQHHKMLTIPSF